MIKKIVIPAAGLGSRLLPMTKEIPKEMMPIFLNSQGKIIVKPLIQALFEEFFQAGLREYCIIVGRQKRTIEDHFTIDHNLLHSLSPKNNSRKDLQQFYDMINASKIFWINQQRPQGFGDAVLYAESFVGEDEFLVSAGDTLIPNNRKVMNKLLELPLKGKNDAVLILKEVEDPRRFGVAVINKSKNGLIVKSVEEKPLHPKSNLSIVALYRFRPSIFSALREVHKNDNEVQLTDAIQKLIQRNGTIHAILLDRDDKIIDVGTAESYLETVNL
jgi:UTP--glucose-1-phosphate uridylyltransferase